jgi:hypothetical protein
MWSTALVEDDSCGHLSIRCSAALRRVAVKKKTSCTKFLEQPITPQGHEARHGLTLNIDCKTNSLMVRVKPKTLPGLPGILPTANRLYTNEDAEMPNSMSVSTTQANNLEQITVFKARYGTCNA